VIRNLALHVFRTVSLRFCVNILFKVSEMILGVISGRLLMLRRPTTTTARYGSKTPADCSFSLCENKFGLRSGTS
jgi:hypothetical protein